MDAQQLATALNSLALFDAAMRRLNNHSNAAQNDSMRGEARAKMTRAIRAAGAAKLLRTPSRSSFLLAEYIYHVDSQREVRANSFRFASRTSRTKWDRLVYASLDQLEVMHSTVESRANWDERRKTIRKHLRAMEQQPCSGHQVILWCLES